MADSIVQLTASDFGEAMAHLSLVFADTDFAGLVPALYQPTDEHMSRNFAVRRGGRIAAIVGLFPIEWIVGGERLRLAGIGGVSVRPDCRGQGLMRALMDEVMTAVGWGAYHAACLGGNRRRYAHWGFEKAGVEASFVVTPNSVAHALPAEAGKGYQVEDARDEDAGAMRGLYKHQVIHCGRSEEAFARHVRNWRREPVAVRDEAGRVAGYACIDNKDSTCVECCFADDRAVDGFLSHMVARQDKPVRLTLPLLETRIFNRVSALCDDVSLIEASNWRVYDWPAVLGSLLRAKHSVRPLPVGSCVVRVRGETAGLRLAVDGKGGAARCDASDEEPDLEAEAGDLVRLLAGPLPLDVPARAGVLAQWRPLPLMIPMQDRI